MILRREDAPQPTSALACPWSLCGSIVAVPRAPWGSPLDVPDSGPGAWACGCGQGGGCAPGLGGVGVSGRRGRGSQLRVARWPSRWDPPGGEALRSGRLIKAEEARGSVALRSPAGWGGRGGGRRAGGSTEARWPRQPHGPWAAPAAFRLPAPPRAAAWLPGRSCHGPRRTSGPRHGSVGSGTFRHVPAWRGFPPRPGRRAAVSRLSVCVCVREPPPGCLAACVTSPGFEWPRLLAPRRSEPRPRFAPGPGTRAWSCCSRGARVCLARGQCRTQARPVVPRRRTIPVTGSRSGPQLRAVSSEGVGPFPRRPHLGG